MPTDSPVPAPEFKVSRSKPLSPWHSNAYVKQPVGLRGPYKDLERVCRAGRDNLAARFDRNARKLCGSRACGRPDIAVLSKVPCAHGAGERHAEDNVPRAVAPELDPAHPRGVLEGRREV